MEEQEKNIQDYIIGVRKRKTAIFAIIIVILFITISVAYLLPSVYKSQSTILIEQQDIPSELVMSTVTSYASQRIQTIQARIMTRTNLLRIVEKFDLYIDELKVETSEEILERMRKDVSLDVISADVVDPRTGRPSTATIAFSLSFKGESPEKVQRVTNELTTLYLDENLTSRNQDASETYNFFKEESARLGESIDELEKKLAVFKQNNSTTLPELQSLNLSVLQRKESEVASIDNALRALDEKSFYLSGQLATIDPGNPAIPGAIDRLKTLQAEYASVKSKYSNMHPDVVRLKSEIDSLEKETGGTNDADTIADQLKLYNGELAQKRQKYTADHPDVVRLEEKITALNAELKAVKSRPAVEHYIAQPENPLYITVQTQLAAAISEIKSMRQQRQGALQKIKELEKSLYDAPQVEREYLTLKRDYENAVKRYQETKAKQMQADIAKQLESESKGERFTLIDPATLPEKPISPNRPAIVFLGLVLALGCGLGFAVVADVISGAVRGARGVQRLMGVLPLAVIPYEMNLQDTAKTTRIKKRVILLFIAVIVFAILFIHFVVSPLDVMWFRILRKFEVLTA